MQTKPMNLKMIAGCCLAGACLLSATALNAAVAVLELERSKDAKTWEKVPLDASLLSATGGVLQNMSGSSMLYRLKVNDDRNAGFVTALTLINAPAQAVSIARQFMEDLLLDDPEGRGDPEGGWNGAQLGPVCY